MYDAYICEDTQEKKKTITKHSFPEATKQGEIRNNDKTSVTYGSIDA